MVLHLMFLLGERGFGWVLVIGDKRWWGKRVGSDASGQKLKDLTCMHAQLKKTYEIFYARSGVLRCTQEVVNSLYKDLWSQSKIQLTVVTERCERIHGQGCACARSARAQCRGSRGGARRVRMSVRARSARAPALPACQTLRPVLDSSRARGLTREPRHPHLTARPHTRTTRA